MRDHATTLPASAACTNCGDPRVGVYCAVCGEKQPHHHDLTMGHLAHEVFHELVHLDSKLFRTLRDLVVRPGELTAAYFAGRKKSFIAPMRLFLTLFALQFLAYTAYKPVAVYSVEGMIALDPANKLGKKFEEIAAKRKIPPAQLYERIDHRWHKNMSLINLLSVAGVALTLKLVYARHRRFMAEHVVFATHFMCFTYLFSLAAWPVYALFGIRASGLNNLVAFLSFLVVCIYLFYAMRRYYGQRGAKGVVKSVMVWVGMFVTSMLLIFGSFIVALVQVF